MNCGTQLISPNGYGPLVCERTYYLLANQAHRARVLLVWFIEPPSERSANGLAAQPYMLAMDRDEFEFGLTSNAVTPHPEQSSLPPWLGDITSRNPATLDQDKRAKRESNEQRVLRRLDSIQPALDRYSEIIDAPDPIRVLNRIANTERKNPMRFRAFFLLYVLFGSNQWALMPLFHRIGHWNRGDKNRRSATLGRRSRRKAARKASALSAADRQLILDTYRRYRGIGQHRYKIYINAMRRDWGCRVAKHESGRFEIYHPQSRVFPTYRQYDYQLIKTFGIRQLQIDRWGHEWVRNRYAISNGRYAEHVGNILERVETDGYWSESFPSDNRGNPLPKLITVKLIDTVSNVVFGVGFSVGGEKATAYAAACFSAAIGLDRYLWLFGLEAGEFDTPSAGLMASLITDRGPGSGEALAEHVALRELTLSYSGQSKSTAESGHPRHDGNAEAPSYTVSDLSAVGMAKQELWRVIRHNHISDASARLTPEMAAANVAANPFGIWHFLQERGRTSGRSMSFDQAVRTFLQPVQFRFDRNGLSLHKQQFSLPKHADDKLTRHLKSGTISGYCLPTCVRHAWIEMRGELHLVTALLPFADDSDQLYRSLLELEAHDQRMRDARLDQDDNKRAATLYGHQSYRDQTGKEFEASQKRRGRAKIKRPQNK